MSETGHVIVCQGNDCRARAGEGLLERLREAVAAQGVEGTAVVPYQCFGACETGAHVVLDAQRAWLSGVKVGDEAAVVAALQGQPAPERLAAGASPEQQEMFFSLIEMGIIEL